MLMKCEECNKSFTKRRHLRLHIARTHIPKSEWKFQCEICKNRYADIEILTRHMKNHDDKRPKFKCGHDDCDKEFLSQFGRDKHFKNCHQSPEAKKLFKCDVENCDFTCSKRKMLTQHSFEHTGLLPFSCETCEMKFKTLSHKLRHEKVHKGYQCEKCEKKFSLWSELLSHRAKNHPKEFKCENCDKVYFTAHKLRQHALIHSSVREVFKCSECDRSFTRKQGLKTHVLVVHKNIREFSCSECGKSYAHRHTLNKHIRNQHRTTPKPKKPRKDKIDVASRIIGFNKSLFDDQFNNNCTIQPNVS